MTPLNICIGLPVKMPQPEKNVKIGATGLNISKAHTNVARIDLIADGSMGHKTPRLI